jgi:hypothetical protein
MKNKADTVTTIGVICKDYDAFRNWRKEFLVPGPSSRFIYVNPLRLQDVSKVRFDALIKLPCCYEHDYRDLEECCETIKKNQFRASIHDLPGPK